MESLHYSNVMIAADKDWRPQIIEWIGDAPVNFKLVKITRSKNWLVQISATERAELRKVQDKAIADSEE